MRAIQFITNAYYKKVQGDLTRPDTSPVISRTGTLGAHIMGQYHDSDVHD